jgi:hypothetical protein
MDIPTGDAVRLVAGQRCNRRLVVPEIGGTIGKAPNEWFSVVYLIHRFLTVLKT